MPALSTNISFDLHDQHLYGGDLLWWDARGVLQQPGFTPVENFGYTDHVKKVTLAEFVAMNREQIQNYGSEIWRFKEQIEKMTVQIRRGAWDDAEITVTLYEWESGYS